MKFIRFDHVWGGASHNLNPKCKRIVSWWSFTSFFFFLFLHFFSQFLSHYICSRKSQRSLHLSSFFWVQIEFELKQYLIINSNWWCEQWSLFCRQNVAKKSIREFKFQLFIQMCLQSTPSKGIHLFGTVNEQQQQHKMRTSNNKHIRFSCVSMYLIR